MSGGWVPPTGSLSGERTGDHQWQTTVPDGDVVHTGVRATGTATGVDFAVDLTTGATALTGALTVVVVATLGATTCVVAGTRVVVVATAPAGTVAWAR
jgi:hypothetical protein